MADEMNIQPLQPDFEQIKRTAENGYNPKSETTQLFFKMVQNMMHWAVTHQTAAEIVYNRADADMPHMGLTTWKNAPDGRVQKKLKKRLMANTTSSA